MQDSPDAFPLHVVGIVHSASAWYT